MENNKEVNDQLTSKLLELNRYCFEHQMEFQLDISEKKKNKIKKRKSNTIYVTLTDINDEEFLNEVTTFLEQLLD